MGQSVAGRVLSVLDAFADAPGTLRLTDVARRTGLPLPTALRMVRELVAWGGLERASDGSYRLGTRMRVLGEAALCPRGLLAAALPSLRALAARTGGHADVAVESGGVALFLVSGEKLPLGATAAGKVLLAAGAKGAFGTVPTVPGTIPPAPGTAPPAPGTASGAAATLGMAPPAAATPGTASTAAAAPGAPATPSALSALSAPATLLPRYTPRTVTSPARLAAQLARVREDGIAAAHEEYRLGELAYAAPVVDATGTPFAAVSVTARTGTPHARLTAAVRTAAAATSAAYAAALAAEAR
ncbi:IclR family transcriptional regulator [Streptomyces sp. G45]|uniref:IclR family transcriptional regulator n=1 Tax=Streptomyces sp. G45 TaxID=3406627 RepID=UPI003C28593E